MWLTPDAAVVNVSTAWTVAEATTGGTPRNTTSSVLLTIPNAMPSAPSIICAANPTRMKGSITAKIAAKSMVDKSGIVDLCTEQPKSYKLDRVWSAHVNDGTVL